MYIYIYIYILEYYQGLGLSLYALGLGQKLIVSRCQLYTPKNCVLVSFYTYFVVRCKSLTAVLRVLGRFQAMNSYIFKVQ